MAWATGDDDNSIKTAADSGLQWSCLPGRSRHHHHDSLSLIYLPVLVYQIIRSTVWQNYKNSLTSYNSTVMIINLWYHCTRLPARGREVNGRLHRLGMFCWCLSLLPFQWLQGQQLYTLRCIFIIRVTSRDYKRLVSHGFRHHAQWSLCQSGTHRYYICFGSEG